MNDRREGFLQGHPRGSPVPRWQIVLAQALGGTTLALLQGILLLLILAPLTGIRFGAASLFATLGVMALLAFGLTNLGLLIAWRMESTQGFHAIMNLLLIPDMAALWRVFSEYGRTRLVSMDNEVQSVNVWAGRFSAGSLP